MYRNDGPGCQLNSNFSTGSWTSRDGARRPSHRPIMLGTGRSSRSKPDEGKEGQSLAHQPHQILGKTSILRERRCVLVYIAGGICLTEKHHRFTHLLSLVAVQDHNFAKKVHSRDIDTREYQREFRRPHFRLNNFSFPPRLEPFPTIRQRNKPHHR